MMYFSSLKLVTSLSIYLFIYVHVFIDCSTLAYRQRLCEVLEMAKTLLVVIITKSGYDGQEEPLGLFIRTLSDMIKYETES